MQENRFFTWMFVAFFMTIFSVQLQASLQLGDGTDDRLSWDVIGLDSNKPATDGPDTFPVGYRFCDSDSTADNNVTATFTWADNDPTYIGFHPGTETTTAQAATIDLGTVEADGCVDVYFNVQILTRTKAAHDQTRSYTISITSEEQVSAVSTSTNELYIEKLVSQNRNEVYSIDGPSTVVKGETYTFILYGATAPGGYEQFESFINFPNNIFRVVSIDAEYTQPAGYTETDLYADGCGWDYTGADSGACTGTNKVGDQVKLTYEIEILGTGTADVTTLLYDFSGSSFHYNSDYGVIVKSITAIDPSDLGIILEKTTQDPYLPSLSAETATFEINATAQDYNLSSVDINDTMPSGWSYVSGTALVDGVFTEPTVSGQTLTWSTGSLSANTSRIITYDAITDNTTFNSGDVSTNTAEVIGINENNASQSFTYSDTENTTFIGLDINKTSSANPGEVQPGDTITYTIGAQNPSAIGTNSILRDVNISDPLPTGTTYTPSTSLITYPSTITAQSGNYADDFESVTVSGSSGTLDWSGNSWTGDIGDPVILSVDSNYVLQLEQTDAASRKIPFTTDSAYAVLTFDYERTDKNNGDLEVRISTNDGTSYDILLDTILAVDPADTGFNSVSYNISEYITTTTRIQFKVINGGNNKNINIDNVNIDVVDREILTNQTAGDPSALLDPSTLSVDLYPQETITIEFDVTVDANASYLGSTSIDNTVSVTTQTLLDPYTASTTDPIAQPDLNVSIACDPNTLDTNETTTCTVVYCNNGTGPADYIQYHIDYPENLGTVTNFNSTGTLTGTATDPSNEEIILVVGGASPTLGNVTSGDCGTFTFDFNLTASGTNGTFDMPVKTYQYGPNEEIANGGSGPEDQNVSDVDTITYLPITISYVYPQLHGSSVEIDFTTSTETANVGFNIYAVKGKGERAKQWVKLNKELIVSSVFDSLVPTDYQVTVDIPDGMKVRKIGIAGVDVDGVEDRHGPYKVDRESGSKTEVIPIEWSKVRQAYKKDKKARKAKRQAKKASRKALRKTMKEQIVNLDVNKDAMYRVTHEDLMAVDIDLRGFKASQIAVSLRDKGVTRHIGALNQRGKWTQESVITFIGEAPKGEDALYLESNRYRLSLNKKLVEESEEIEPLTTKELVFENNNAYSWTIPGEDPFYDKMFYTRGEGKPGILTHSFTMDEVPDTQMELTVYVSAFSKLTHHLSVSLNGSEIGSIQENGYKVLSVKMKVNPSMLYEGDNEITITAYGTESNTDVFMYDKAVFTYDDGKANEVQIPVITFNDRLRKKEIKPKRGTNYLIISHPMFMTEVLDNYISQKEGEGWKIQVVDVEDIYSAYGYGMKTPEAIKDYLDVAKRKGVTHVQLVGAASYDYHDYLGLGSVSFIPSIYVPTAQIIKYTPCDSCLVADENGIPELAIGRWPVRTLEGLETIINKTLTWKDSGQSNARTALLIADQKEEGADFAKQQDALANVFESSEYWNGSTRVYMDEKLATAQNNSNEAVSEARDVIFDSLNSGVGIVSFSGHSAPTVWSIKRLLKYSDADSVNNEGQTALALPLACYTNYADSPSVNTMAHQFLAEGENGFVAIYGAATLSQFSQNGAAVTRVSSYLLQGKTLGEAIRQTKEDLGMKYNDIIRNSNLLGDVTLDLK